ncbi:ankyrin repeat protein [Tirmania nivea]|nr:ankyrin repeat protein [Tirmania nivea]
MTFGDELVKAAEAGDNDTIKKLLSDNVEGIDERSGGITALLAAAMAGKIETVKLLLDKGADVKLRDSNSYTIITLALNHEQKKTAEWLVENCPELIVTDPRLPKGEAWIRKQFQLMSDNVTDPASKPSQDVLECIIKRDLGETDGRTVSHVYWEHILLRYVGDIPLDIERNYSETLTLSLVGTYERVLKGHKGIEESARLLNSKLPTTQYDIIGTIVETRGNWVTERWGYHDGNFQVTDGIDTFLIENGKIQVKMINYTVEPAEDRWKYNKKMGISEA